MFGFLKPRGELVELDGRQVVFLTEKTYRSDSCLSVRLSLPEPSRQNLDLDVRILNQRPGKDRRYVTVAVVETPRDFPSLIGVPTREAPRAPERVVLESERLPSHRAVTQDLSTGGFRTELAAELPIGELLPITFVLDPHRGISMELMTQVRWVEKVTDNRFLTGFSFPAQGPYNDRYEWFVRWVESEPETEVQTLFKESVRMPEADQSLTAQKPTIRVNPQASSVARSKIEPRLEPKPKPKVKPKPRTKIELQEKPPRIPFVGTLRGWAWEQVDDKVVVVIADKSGRDHWIEFPGCLGLQADCGPAKISLAGVEVIGTSELLEKYTGVASPESLRHFRFLDQNGRGCLDIIASDCREAV